MRQNPVAKQDLQNRVHSYRALRAEEHAERVAVAELAAERREQKALEFVHNRFKKAAPVNQVGLEREGYGGIFFALSLSL